jgi:Zn-finger nucleic acid-binding protein
MICPACKNDMIVVEYHDIELDYCNECHGVWFDSGELELLVRAMNMEEDQALIADLFHSPSASTSEKKRKCPICNRKMRKATVGGKPEIIIDLCKREDGIWFDGGELAQLIKQLAGGSAIGEGRQQKIVDFLGEVFQAQE